MQVRAPIFQELPRLPTPLGSFLYTAPYFTSLPLLDRLSALPLVEALLGFDIDEVHGASITLWLIITTMACGAVNHLISARA